MWSKCKVLYKCWGNPKHKYRLENEWIESSPEEKEFGLLVEKLNMTKKCVVAAQTYPGYIKSSVTTRSREPLYPALMRPTWDMSISWALKIRKIWSYGAGPEEGHEDSQRVGTPLL